MTHNSDRQSASACQNQAGLTDGEFREIVRLLIPHSGSWYIERQEDRAGNVSVVLVTNDDDEDQELPKHPAYVLSRIGAVLLLSVRERGNDRLIGKMADVPSAVAFLLGLAASPDVIALSGRATQRALGFGSFEPRRLLMTRPSSSKP
jgi:hypothetical protein